MDGAVYAGIERVVLTADHTPLGERQDGSIPSGELFPADTTVAGKLLVYLFDEDDDRIPEDGELNESGTVDVADILIAERIPPGLVTATTLHLQHGDVRTAGCTGRNYRPR